MTFWEILIIGIGLAMDCFAVSLGVGTKCIQRTWKSVVRLAFSFGLFQGGMTFLGWLAGKQVANLISGIDHWVAFLLLLYVGGKMMIESFKGREEIKPEDPTQGLPLLMLSIATSIDALAVGISLAFINVSILESSLVIGGTSLGFSIAGFLIGDRLGRQFGRRMELIGGLVLIGIGMKVLVDHLTGI